MPQANRHRRPNPPSQSLRRQLNMASAACGMASQPVADCKDCGLPPNIEDIDIATIYAMPTTGSSGMLPTTRPPAETMLAGLSVPADPKRATRAGTASAATAAAGSGHIPSLLQSAPAWTQVWYRRQPASSKPRTQFRRVNGFREMEILRRALGRQTPRGAPVSNVA